MDEMHSVTLPKALADIIASLQPVMEQNYAKVLAHHQGCGWPELDVLRDEIGLCLLFGLNQAAIMLTHHFLEALVKYALIYHHWFVQDTTRVQEGGWAIDALEESIAEGVHLYGTNDLDTNITIACVQGLLTPREKTQLHAFRDACRHAAGHAATDEAGGDASTLQQAREMGAGSSRLDPSNVQRLVHIPLVQGFVQAMQADRDALPYFRAVDTLAMEIVNNRLGTRAG